MPAQLVISTVNPGNRAVTLKAIHVCASWIYVVDQVLLPTPTTNLSQVRHPSLFRPLAAGDGCCQCVLYGSWGCE